jgi:proteic killer suppression protein
MIKSFKHKGLKDFFLKGKIKGITSEHASKIKRILALLNETEDLSELNYIGFRLHKLKGKMQNLWSITVNENYRITFEFKDKNAYILDYTDYH